MATPHHLPHLPVTVTTIDQEKDQEHHSYDAHYQYMFGYYQDQTIDRTHGQMQELILHNKVTNESNIIVSKRWISFT